MKSFTGQFCINEKTFTLGSQIFFPEIHFEHKVCLNQSCPFAVFIRKKCTFEICLLKCTFEI